MRVKTKKDRVAVMTLNQIHNDARILKRTMGPKSNIEAVNKVLIETAHDYLRMTTNDLEVQITKEIRKKVLPDRSDFMRMLVDPKILEAVTEPDNPKTPQGVNSYIYKDKATRKLHFKNIIDDSNISIAGTDAEEYPHCKETGSVKEFEFVLSGEKQIVDFIEKMEYVLKAVSNDETRHNLCGVFLHLTCDERDCLKFVATDGHRLHYSMLEYTEQWRLFLLEDDSPGKIFNGDLMRRLCKILKSDKAETVMITGYQDGYCVVSVSNNPYESWTLTSKFIDGQFPDYKQVIPVVNDNFFKFFAIKKNLEKVLKKSIKISKAAEIDYPGLRWNIKQDSKNIIVKNGGDTISELDIPVKILSGKEIEVGFNPKYILDAIAIGGNKTELYFSIADNLAPMTIVASRKGYGSIVMPTRI